MKEPRATFLSLSGYFVFILFCLFVYLFCFPRYFEKLVYVMIDIDPQTASPPQLQATMKALPGVLEVRGGEERGGYRLSQSCWSTLVYVWFRFGSPVETNGRRSGPEYVSDTMEAFAGGGGA